MVKSKEKEMSKENELEKKSFEEAFTEIEQIVNQLQTGEIPLEESMKAFQKGIQLINFCTKTLNNAEETMTSLMNDQGETEPFDALSENKGE